jgi:UDP-N-acetylmuramoyl-L-alanyl-D-glutamate--2,6-diaminopimelate ligase
MTLEKLLADLPYLLDVRGDRSTPIGQLTANSREKVTNGLFFCIPGTRVDAHTFAPQAVQNGCAALVVERFLPELSVPQVLVSNTRASMARMAAAFYDHPARKMKLVGVTGTKGKTTTSYLVKAIMEQAGYSCGLIGTTGNMIGNKKLKSELTTPDPIDLQATLAQMADAGVEVVSMEVSAHALDLHKLDGLIFEAACYTNLSQDHLDYFQTMERYLEAKKLLFTSGMARNASVNADEETTPSLLKDMQIPYITYGICCAADLFARDIEVAEDGVRFDLKLRDAHNIPVRLKMTGMFNVYNAIAAASLAMILGVSPEDIRLGLESVKAVPGRIEMLPTNTPYKVILDYSHSPDALENILTTVREFARKLIIVVFGCGGDRDHGKRPIMGKIAGKLADYSILTSDNPRTEDPYVILQAIEEGIKPTGGKYTVIENRREAIRHALTIGQEGDVIILAGKGHETYQEIMGVKNPFDEKVVVAELLAEMRS